MKAFQLGAKRSKYAQIWQKNLSRAKLVKKLIKLPTNIDKLSQLLALIDRIKAFRFFLNGYVSQSEVSDCYLVHFCVGERVAELEANYCVSFDN